MSYLRVKICGITDPVDGLEAARLGADAMGLNFHPPSPRYVDLEKAKTILRELPPLVEPVGIFVDQTIEQVNEGTLKRLSPVIALRTLQLYGKHWEAADVLPLRLIPAFPVRDGDSLVAIIRYLENCRTRNALPAAILVDAHAPGEYGGTGRTLPWRLLADFQTDVPIFLAGGLTPDNVADAVRIVRPYGVDVASGVESSPGRKDREKMRRFIGNAREAAAKMSD
jgi:phosphoribosylanthranilate isomerase